MPRVEVTEKTYEYFAFEYPNVSKEELERMLLDSRRTESPDYLNGYEPSRTMTIGKTAHNFHLPKDLANRHNLPHTIELLPDEDGVIYQIHE